MVRPSNSMFIHCSLNYVCDSHLQAWMCGGRIVYSPCSRASHLEGAKTRTYRAGKSHYMDNNYKRIAEVWLEDYKELYYKYKPHIRVSTKQCLVTKARIGYTYTIVYSTISCQINNYTEHAHTMKQM